MAFCFWWTVFNFSLRQGEWYDFWTLQPGEIHVLGEPLPKHLPGFTMRPWPRPALNHPRTWDLTLHQHNYFMQKSCKNLKLCNEIRHACQDEKHLILFDFFLTGFGPCVCFGPVASAVNVSKKNGKVSHEHWNQSHNSKIAGMVTRPSWKKGENRSQGKRCSSSKRIIGD